MFGSEAARLLTSNEATLEGYAIKHVFDLCDSIMKNVIVLFIKKYVAVSLYFKFKKVFFMADRKFKCKFGHTVIMNWFSLKAKNAMISRTSKLLEIYDLHASEPQQKHDIIKNGLL